MARQSSLNYSLLSARKSEPGGGAEDWKRTPGVHVAARIVICRPESCIPRDIHL